MLKIYQTNINKSDLKATKTSLMFNKKSNWTIFYKKKTFN